MTWLLIVGGVGMLCFAAVLLFGAPYLPTLKPQVKAALALANLQPGQTLLELGCGDGRVALAAAQQGIMVVGYELNPILVIIARLRTWRYRQLVRIHWGNFWQAEWPSAQAIFVFLIPKYMGKLDKRIEQYGQPVTLVSFAFAIPDRPTTQTKQGIFVYRYK